VKICGEWGRYRVDEGYMYERGWKWLDGMMRRRCSRFTIWRQCWIYDTMSRIFRKQRSPRGCKVRGIEVELLAWWKSSIFCFLADGRKKLRTEAKMSSMCPFWFGLLNKNTFGEFREGGIHRRPWIPFYFWPIPNVLWLWPKKFIVCCQRDGYEVRRGSGSSLPFQSFF
jgi:hypothetical protein